MSVDVLSASVSYAYSLYQQSVAALGPREAYAVAVKVAQLTTPAERAALRNAVSSASR